MVALLDSLVVPPPDPSPADWNDEGVVILPSFISSKLIAAYEDAWVSANAPDGLTTTHGGLIEVLPGERLDAGGWQDCTPYMRYPEIKNLVAPLDAVLEHLIGEPAGMNLNLTGWMTTERDWHQDSYLNEPSVGDYYAAVWIALGPIHPDSGPFQYVPGSHRWPQVTREKIAPYVDMSHYLWPKESEKVLSPLFEKEIAERGAEVVTHLPQAGDVLIWHGRLLHRGTKANVKGAYRPAFIAHFSGIHHRPAMPRAKLHDAGGWYFPIENSGPVR